MPDLPAHHRAHLVQLDIAWEDPQTNFDAVDRLLTRAPVNPGDLILLPEMFAVGFSLNIDVTTDRGETLGYLERLAEDTGAVVQGGRPVRPCDCDKALNRMSAIDGSVTPPKLLAEYDKIHPFSFAREPEAFTGGGDIVTYRWGGERGITVAPIICYDLRFPELFRLAALRGAECFALGACWPKARQHHWRALSVARAIECQAYTLACNRTGNDPYLEYAGGSIAIDPQGNVLGELGDEEGVLSVEIDPESVRDWRERFPVLRDAKLLATRDSG
ncbi:MAG: nitrilase-related carbon-nitrogen hydrolase [Phycisphaerales bacterium JB040]